MQDALFAFPDKNAKEMEVFHGLKRDTPLYTLPWFWVPRSGFTAETKTLSPLHVPLSQPGVFRYGEAKRAENHSEGQANMSSASLQSKRGNVWDET